MGLFVPRRTTVVVVTEVVAMGGVVPLKQGVGQSPVSDLTWVVYCHFVMSSGAGWPKHTGHFTVAAATVISCPPGSFSVRPPK